MDCFASLAMTGWVTLTLLAMTESHAGKFGPGTTFGSGLFTR